MKEKKQKKRIKQTKQKQKKNKTKQKSGEELRTKYKYINTHIERL